MDEALTVETIVLPDESVVVTTEPAPPPSVPFEVPFPLIELPPDEVELLELPEPLLPLVELLEPPIEPPVGEDPPAVAVTELGEPPAVTTEVPAVRVPETDAVEAPLPVAAARAPNDFVRCEGEESRLGLTATEGIANRDDAGGVCAFRA